MTPRTTTIVRNDLESEIKNNVQSLFPEDRIPVIVGVGEIVDRPKEITAGLEPLDAAGTGAKAGRSGRRRKTAWRGRSLDVVNFLSWRYRDPEKLLAQRLGITPSHLYYGPVGGESPIRYIHEAAKRIARGECSVAAVCGAEAQSTATKAAARRHQAALDAVRA